MMDEVKTMLQYAFQTSNQLTIPVSAPGSAGMEATFQNLLEHGDKAIVCQNGVFGGRMKENVERAGGKAVIFNTITVSDGISMGSPGMRYSLVSREVIADSIEAVAGAEVSKDVYEIASKSLDGA